MKKVTGLLFKPCFVVARQLLHLLLLTILLSCNTGRQNPYNLDIVNDLKAYNRSVEQDPDNELVDITTIIPDIQLDIRYATTNNFTGEIIYTAPKAYLRKPVAFALRDIQEQLKTEGLGLKVFDAYRPYQATIRFYEVYLDTTFVASPRTGSVHNKGCAVDLTLIDISTGKEVLMPTPFDDFTEYASIECMDLPEEAIRNREKLINIMREHNFSPYSAEWWHYNYNDRSKYKITDLTFKELEKKRKN